MPQTDLDRLWEEHTKYPFATRDTESTLSTSFVLTPYNPANADHL
ncbi:MAG: hypothetical protein ACRD4O_14995 [Bryobacteraceae bacterium]